MPEAHRGRHAPLFRCEFTLKAPASSARLIICGLGCHEAFLNGQRIGDHVLDPAQTDYDQRVLFVTHDVTALLRPGANALGIMLGDGWFNQDLVWQQDMSYGPPRLAAVLEITPPGADRVVIRSDETWLCARGPITGSNIYAGECHDARMEQDGWNDIGFDPAKHKHAYRWFPAELAAPPGGRFERQTMPPMRAVQELRPVAITEPQRGYQVVDMGQNFSGWARLRTTAPAGTCIRLRFAESLADNGMVDTASTGVFATGVEQVDTYICKGGGVEEVWEPRFTYHGFRYVEVVGWPGALAPEDITGVVVHTDLPPAGGFESSDARLNKLHDMAAWTHRSNLHGFPEDCPVRERCGWLGDAHIIGDFSLYAFSGASFWAKYLDDIETARQRNGGLPAMIAPGRRTGGTASPDWMVAPILIAWSHYVFYGDRSILERHWEAVQAIMAHFETLSENGLLPHGLGDWFDPGVSAHPRFTPPVVTSTLLYGHCARLVSQMAARLGDEARSLHYTRLAEQIHDALRTHHYKPSDHTFGSHTADAMALQLGFAPPQEEQAIADQLARDIREKHQLHATCGIMGIRHLFEALSRYGHGDVALALMHQDTYPSFGDLIRCGATTLWEYWGEAEVDALHGPRSLNHPMFAGYGGWFFHSLGGIRPDPEHPGFQRFFLQPRPIPGLAWVRTWHDSPHGRITSSWSTGANGFSWEVVVPDGTTALVHHPDSPEPYTLEAGRHLLS